MPLERAKKIQSIVRQALEKPKEERLSFIHAACQPDESFELVVLGLLAKLEKLDPRYSEKLLRGSGKELPKGTKLGAYEIVSLIGSGGMGTVYKAARGDDAFNRYVAIKVSNLWSTAGGLERRILDERKILASLEHANIAQLFDAGTSSDGRPYFVMEYVSGQTITAYCATQRLEINARLRLFAQVCNAVAYAHRNLIIHRDLKPANILVKADGTVKLLDFGIAKILQDSDAEPSSEDNVGRSSNITKSFGAGTPAYASPEQLAGSTVTIASDVYSLAVVLHETLTGFLPPRKPLRTQGGIPPLIYTDENIKPSDLLRKFGQQGAASMPHRQISMWWLRTARVISGDLDFVILKGLRPKPDDRYRSVTDLELDINRYLDKRPILARKQPISNHVAKFAARNARLLSNASRTTSRTGLPLLPSKDPVGPIHVELVISCREDARRVVEGIPPPGFSVRALN